MFTQQPHVVIDVGDHPVEVRIGHVAIADIRLCPFRRHAVRAVRGVGREIKQKRFRPILFDEPHALTEPDVGAVALELFELPVPFVGVIEVVVAPVIRGLTNPAATMPHHILKAPVLRTMRSVVAEVPLANHPGSIAVRRKEIRDRLFIPVHHRAPRTGSVSARVIPGGCPS